MYFKKRRIGITPKLTLLQFMEGWQEDWNTGIKKKMVRSEEGHVHGDPVMWDLKGHGPW